MAEGLNVLGSNVVYNTTRPVNQYLQNAAKIQAQNAAEQKMLQDDLNKVKIDGVRDADRQNYIKKYQDWKDTYAKVVGTKDPVQKAQLKSDFDKKALELQDFVYDSKNLNKGEQELNKIFLDPTKRENFTDDAVLRYQKSKTLPKDDPNYIRDLTAFERRVDLSKVDDKFRQADTYLKNNQVSGGRLESQERFKAGNRTGTNSVFSANVDPKKQLEEYYNLYDSDRDVKYAIKQQYKELFDLLPEDQAKAQALADYASKRPLSRKENYRIMDDVSQENHRANRLFDQAHPLSVNYTNGEQPQDLNIPFSKGVGNVNASGYVKVPMATKNFAGSSGIDLDTGKPTKLKESSNDYQVVGVANFPFITHGNEKGSLSQPKFAENNPNSVELRPMIQVQFKGKRRDKNYLIPYDRMPQNLTKKDKEILSSFKPAEPNQQVKQETKTLSIAEQMKRARGGK